MDTVDKKTRSRMMSRVRSKGNRSTEWRLRAGLVQAGISGWQMHVHGIEGRPDFVFIENRLIVFVDGCFWHACPACNRRPKSRLEYWDNKLERNRIRDREVNTMLKNHGFDVLRFWEHEVKDDLPRVVKKIGAMKL